MYIYICKRMSAKPRSAAAQKREIQGPKEPKSASARGFHSEARRPKKRAPTVRYQMEKVEILFEVLLSDLLLLTLLLVCIHS
jgi:hypothetical protein